MIKRNRNKTKNFTILANEVFQDATISAKAKGLYAYLMTLPDDWKVRKTELHKHFTDGKASIATAFDELAGKGFIQSEKVRDDHGRIIDTIHTVFETSTDFRKSDTETRKTEIGKTEIGESDTTKDYIILKTNNTKEKACSRFQEFWSAYPNKVGNKPAAEKNWKANGYDAIADEIIAAIKSQTSIRDQCAAAGIWIPPWPHGSTYVNGKRWEDDLQSYLQAPPQKQAQQGAAQAAPAQSQTEVIEDIRKGNIQPWQEQLLKGTK